MKRYLTIIAFAFAVCFGMQTATAQDSPELIAKNKTMALAKKVDLSNEQIQEVYKIYLNHEKSEREDAVDALIKTRKSINQILHPQQRKKFAKTFSKEYTRQEKLRSAQ